MDASAGERAVKLFQQAQYVDACAIYSKCLERIVESSNQDDHGKRVQLLLNRSACHLKLKNYEAAIEDYEQVLLIDELNAKAFLKKIKALSSIGKFVNAFETAKTWLEKDEQNVQAKKEVDRLEIVVKALLDQQLDEDDDDVIIIDNGITVDWEKEENVESTPSIEKTKPDTCSNCDITDDNEEENDSMKIDLAIDACLEPPSGDANENEDDDDVEDEKGDDDDGELEVDIADNNDNSHQSGDDKNDGGRTWRFREPPRGLTSEEFQKCPRFMSSGICRFGDKCTEAHCDGELLEWRKRFDDRYEQLQRERDEENRGAGLSYAEQLLEKWMNADNPETIMTSNPPGIKFYCNSDSSITMATKRCNHAWLFTLTSKLYLARVILLDESKRHFNITSVTIGPKKNQKSQKLDESCQEWLNPVDQNNLSKNETVYRVKILFRTDIFGTFRQTVVFDFGVEPVMCQQLCVDSSPVIDVDKLQAELTLSESGRWEVSTIPIVEFLPKPRCNRRDAELLEKYPVPSAAQIATSHCLQDGVTSKENYRDRMHSLLYIEEMAQYSNVSKYNIKTWLDLTTRFMLMPSTYSTAKYAQNDELFAHTNLATEISEDTAHGRLILQNVNRVLIAAVDKNNKSENQTPEKLYEAILEEKGKDFVYMRLSAQCVKDLDLQTDTSVYVQIQFQLNRLPLCEMHLAIDNLPDTSMIFPDLSKMIKIPWNPQKQWHEKFDKKLNAKQREAVVAITTSLTHRLPPILLTGPYGTGKTFALAQASRELIKQSNTRILICTHSNSAADLYIKDYLHGYVTDGLLEAKPLRVMYEGRWIQTVSPTILEYCMLDAKSHNTQFRCPTRQDLEEHRIIVTTLSSSRMLYNIGLEKDFFTHILLDEAAQAMELEMIMPLALAGENTRIVMAGDHVQMSPEVHSDFARHHGLHISLLERLYDMFPKTNACKILLCENYRSHKAIIEFTSDLFYDNKLITSGSQPRHEVFYPLSFFTARGEDVQHQNSTGFYNNAEVYEIAERVAYVQKMWPKTWGPFDENSIGVVSPYADQVVRIRAELRKRKLGSISVERVFNVQGKQFRAIFLSTVRTRHTCRIENTGDENDYGFLSNVKLLNTAITRAQSLVAVVGDPVSLCTIGKCRKVWETFIQTCHNNNSLYGITWKQLRSQIDGIELKKTYVLNPLAPEFIPNRLRHGASSQHYSPIAARMYGSHSVSCDPTTNNNTPQQNRTHNMHYMQPFIPQFQMYPQPVGFGYYGMAPWFPRFSPLMAQYPGMNARCGSGGTGGATVRPGLSMPLDPFGFPLVVPSYVPQQLPNPVPSDHYTVVSVSRPTTDETPEHRKRVNSGGGNALNSKSAVKAVATTSFPPRPVWTTAPKYTPPWMCNNNRLAATGKVSGFETNHHRPEGQDGSTASQSATMLLSPYLQREFYSYIQQKDGQNEANKFLDKLLATSYEGRPFVRNNAAAAATAAGGGRAKDQKNATVVSVSRRQRTRSQSSSAAPADAVDSINGSIIDWNKLNAGRSVALANSNSTKTVSQQQQQQQQQCKTNVNSSSTQTESLTAPAYNNNSNNNQLKRAETFNKNATVNVGSVLETERREKADFISEYLMNDPDAPIAVDQVVRFLEDSIDSDDSDDATDTASSSSYAGVLSRQQRGGNDLTTASAQETTAEIFQFTERGVVPSSNHRRSAPPGHENQQWRNLSRLSFVGSNRGPEPAAYSVANISVTANSVQRPTAITPFSQSQHPNHHQRAMPVTSSVSRIRSTSALPQQQTQQPTSTTINSDLYGLLRHQLVAPPQNNTIVESEIQDPLEVLKNLNIKASPGTQAFYQYFS